MTSDRQYTFSEYLHNDLIKVLERLRENRKLLEAYNVVWNVASTRAEEVKAVALSGARETRSASGGPSVQGSLLSLLTLFSGTICLLWFMTSDLIIISMSFSSSTQC